MPNTLQEFLVLSTPRAATELREALLRIPEDKRNWSPEKTARTALDQFAECAILNGYTADMIESRQWAIDDFGVYLQEKAEKVAGEWSALDALLQANVERLITVIRAVPDADLGVEIQLPWEKQTMAQVISYPYWNMTYHQGQINYIASILGRLEPA